jgi:hypothetical protein
MRTILLFLLNVTCVFALAAPALASPVLPVCSPKTPLSAMGTCTIGSLEFSRFSFLGGGLAKDSNLSSKNFAGPEDILVTATANGVTFEAAWTPDARFGPTREADGFFGYDVFTLRGGFTGLTANSYASLSGPAESCESCLWECWRVPRIRCT